MSLLIKMVHPQCSAVERPARKWLDYRSYPKRTEMQTCYWKGMNLPNQKGPDNVQEVTFLFSFQNGLLKNQSITASQRDGVKQGHQPGCLT